MVTGRIALTVSRQMYVTPPPFLVACTRQPCLRRTNNS